MSNISKIIVAAYSEMDYNETNHSGKVTVGQPLQSVVSDYKAYNVTVECPTLTAWTFTIDPSDALVTYNPYGMFILNADGKDFKGNELSAVDIKSVFIKNDMCDARVLITDGLDDPNIRIPQDGVLLLTWDYPIGTTLSMLSVSSLSGSGDINLTFHYLTA